MTETKVAHDCGETVRWAWCPNCDGGVLEYGTHEDRCKGCNGTGLQFPGLSRECRDSRHFFERVVCACYGSRRVPVDSFEVWLDMADDIVVNETPDLLMTHEGTGFEVTFAWNDISGNGIGPTRLDAIKQAVCRAVGAHEGESDAT